MLPTCVIRRGIELSRRDDGSRFERHARGWHHGLITPYLPRSAWRQLGGDAAGSSESAGHESSTCLSLRGFESRLWPRARLTPARVEPSILPIASKQREISPPSRARAIQRPAAQEHGGSAAAMQEGQGGSPFGCLDKLRAPACARAEHAFAPQEARKRPRKELRCSPGFLRTGPSLPQISSLMSAGFGRPLFASRLMGIRRALFCATYFR